MPTPLLVSDQVPSLINGVSQQPPALRLLSQVEEQVNANSDPVRGVGKRPPLRHVSLLDSGSDMAAAKWHTIDRDSAERYVVGATSDGISVWSIAGEPKTVNAPGGFAYLACDDPREDLLFLSVIDYTFVVNKTVSPAMDAGSALADRDPEALVYVRQGTYGGTYKVIVNGSTVGDWTAPDGGSASHSSQIDTTYIATQLYTDIAAALTTGWSITQYGSVIHIVNTNGTDFTIKSEDPLAEDGMRVIKDEVQSFSSLPTRAVDGFIVKVRGSDTVKWAGYYVKFEDSNTSSNTGKWVECTTTGIPISFNAATMPHQLVRETDGTFTFEPVAWVDREIGDTESAPNPAFVGNYIRDIVFHRNRLGLVSGQTVSLSKAGKYFQFWPDTATQLLDSDTIEASANHVKAAPINAAVPFGEKLLLFTSKTQFVLDAQNVLTPKTVTVKPLVEFENSSEECRPVAGGKTLFFTVPRGSYTGMHELLQLPDNNAFDAPDVSAVVPAYIPDNVYRITVSTAVNAVVALSRSVSNKVWVYRYFWEGQEKRQSSWSVWEFPDGESFLHTSFLQGDAYFVVQRGDGIYLDVVDLDTGRTDSGFIHQVHLDRLCYVSGDYNAELDQTQWTMPYPEDGDIQLLTGPDFAVVGSSLNYTRPSSSTVRVAGNYDGKSVYIGRPYTMRVELSTIHVREPVKGNPAATAAVQEARLQVNRVRIKHDGTGYFRAVVTPDYRDPYVYIFTGQSVGFGSPLLGEGVLQTEAKSGAFAFPVLSRNTDVTIELINDSPLPSTFQGFEWEGKLSMRSQRV